MANVAAPKQKVSPVLIGVGVVALAAVAYLLQPQDAPPPVKKPAVTTRTASQNAAALDGITSADLLAKFTPYESPKRDAFLPLVTSSRGIPANGRGNLPGGRGTWILTGISAIDGSKTALIENSSAGLSQFLRTGDTWSGLKVVSVSDSTVTFLNTKGQRTELMFPSADGKVAVKGDDAATFGGEPPGETPPTPGAPAAAAPPVIIVQGGGGNPGGGNQGGNGGDNNGGGLPGGGFPGGGFPGGGFPNGGGGGFPNGGGGFPNGGGFPGQGTFNNTSKSGTAALASNTRTAQDRAGKAILK